jgi:hypothetical protein
MNNLTWDNHFQEVLHKYTELAQQFHDKSEDYENELASRRMWQAKAREFQQSLNTTTMGLEANGFVLALIDGDGAIVSFIPFFRLDAFTNVF